WGGAGAAGRKALPPRGECAPPQPRRKSGIAEQDSRMGREIVVELAEAARNSARALARLGDLCFGRGGLDARAKISELAAGGGSAADVLGCGREVAAAQRDHAQHAVCCRDVP